MPQIAGDSGGAAEAVVDGVTGHVIREPRDIEAVAERLEHVLTDGVAHSAMAMASRARAVAEFDYSVLAARLRAGLAA